MDVMMGLAAIKQTLDITKDLREIDEKVVVAEFKLRLSDMVARLLEAQEALFDAKERERQFRLEIETLKSKLAQKPRLKDQNGLLYEIGDDLTPVGEPYCNLCYVKDEKFFRLRHHSATTTSKAHYRCDNCNTVVTTGPSLPSPRRPYRGPSVV